MPRSLRRACPNSHCASPISTRSGNAAIRPQHFHLSCLFVALCLVSTAAAQSTNERLTKQKLAAQKTEVAQQSTTLAERISKAGAQSTPDWLVSSLQLESNQLTYLQLVLTQQEVLVEKRDDLERQLKYDADDPAQAIIDEIQDSAPYSFLLLERMRDDLDDAIARQNLLKIEIESAQELIEQARQDLDKRKKDRRRVRDLLQSTKDSAQRVQLERQLILAQNMEQIAQELLQLRQLTLATQKVELEVQRKRTAAMRGAADLVAKDAPFTRENFEEKLAEIKAQENALRSSLASFQSRLAEVTSSNSIESSDNQKSKDLIRQGMSLISESLADLVVLRFTWQKRFRIENKMADQEEVEELAEQLMNFQKMTSNSRRVLEIRLKEVRLRLMNLKSKGQLANNPEAWLLQEMLGIGETRARFLQQTERLLRRFHGELDIQKDALTLQAKMHGLLATLKDWWSYELFAVEDRPVTLGKVVSAILLFLGGWILSRRISRMLGRRMLPRLGVHDGASMAVQTIAFYIMIFVCGFLTLDMLSIPLTAFTFLGGAAAIAVGFGSQNVLNNFISGLIILGEQPVRVGDLVEIDGLHANIEHIGPRSTRVRTGENLEIIVPNSRFLENNVTNWTLSNDRIRAKVTVGVAYGSPVDQVLELLQRAVNDEPLALTDPAPIILFNDFGDNSLNFEVHFWVRMRTLMQCRLVESNVRRHIDHLFRESDIVIAFPQCDVHLDMSKPLEIALSPETSNRQAPIRRSA